MPFSIRLDPQTDAKLRRLTATTGRSRSDVVREAVAQYAADVQRGPRPGQSAFDRLKPFIGIVRTGGANYSDDTHTKYRALLRRNRRA